MKKTLLIIISFVALLPLKAQDLIVMDNGQKIEALVKSVDVKTLTYIAWDNQDGPTYTIEKKDIYYVRYANGKEDVFPVTKSEYSTDVYAAITRSGKTYYYDNGTPHSEAYYANFIKKHCPPAYNQYCSGRKLVRCGWGLLAGGLTLDAVGVTTKYLSGGDGAALWAGHIMCSVAGGMEIAFIPCIAVGYTRKNKRSISTYNSTCAGKPIQYFSLNACSDGLAGVGIAFNF